MRRCQFVHSTRRWSRAGFTQKTLIICTEIYRGNTRAADIRFVFFVFRRDKVRSSRKSLRAEPAAGVASASPLHLII